MTKSLLPKELSDNQVRPRGCGRAPGGDSDETAPHPRPAGVDLEMVALYAADYGVDSPDEGPLQPMDLRPILDAAAACWDRCSDCLAHHLAAVAASPPLTTHLVGVALLVSNIREANARLVLQMLDPDGCAIALTIRNSGLEPAVAIADAMGAKRRQALVNHALNVVVPVGWIDMPVSNLCPPATRVGHPSLGDEQMLADLRSDGYLP